MSHVRQFRLCVLVVLISLATFSAARADGPRTAGAPGEKRLEDPLPPLARIWDWLLGFLPAGSAAGVPPPPPVEDGGDLGPEMDPNGNPPTRTP